MFFPNSLLAWLYLFIIQVRSSIPFTGLSYPSIPRLPSRMDCSFLCKQFVACMWLHVAFPFLPDSKLSEGRTLVPYLCISSAYFSAWYTTENNEFFMNKWVIFLCEGRLAGKNRTLDKRNKWFMFWIIHTYEGKYTKH